MKKVVFIGIVFILASIWPTKGQMEVMNNNEPQKNAVRYKPETVSTQLTVPKVAMAQEKEPGIPARITISSIKLNSLIQKVGLDDQGRMDVPSGSTNRVGWYAAGTRPGQSGSAVLDAHVYAAFKNLDKIKLGDEIVITDDSGGVLKFIVKEIDTLPLDKLSTAELFNRQDAKWIVLITCAGKKTNDERGYDKRLVVRADLVDN